MAYLQTIFFVSVCCVILTSADRIDNRDEGILQFRCYLVDKADTFNFKKAFRILDTATYVIKGNKVRRRAYSTNEQLSGSYSNSSGERVDTYIRVEDPGFLIDFDKNVFYSYHKDSAIIEERPISTLDFDFLYGPRALNVVKTKLINIDTTTTIARYGSQSLYQGKVWDFEAKDTGFFRCAIFPLTIRSPVNNWVPDVRYDIVALALKLKGKNSGKHIGWFVVEIYDIQGGETDSAEFVIDLRHLT